MTCPHRSHLNEEVQKNRNTHPIPHQTLRGTPIPMTDDRRQHTGNGHDNRGVSHQPQSEETPQPYLLAQKYPDMIQPHSVVRLFTRSLIHPLMHLQATSPSHCPGCVPPWRVPGLYASTQEQCYAAPYANQNSSDYEVWRNMRHDVTVPFTPVAEIPLLSPYLLRVN